MSVDVYFVIQVESKKRKRLALQKDAKDNIIDLSSNRKASLRSKSFVDISSSSKGTSSVKIVKVKKVSKVIKSPNEDDDFVSVPVVGQVNVKKAEIVYRYPPGLVSSIYRSLNDNQKDVVKEIRFGFVEDFVVKKFSREICSWVLERYDEKRNVLCINNKDIHITRRGVHDIYGLPMGDISMKIPKKSRSGIVVIKNWRNQFSISRIRLPNLRELLEKSTDSDSIHVKNPQDTGPVAFLVLLYLHCTKSSSESFERVYPASSYWSPVKVKDKLKEAFSDGGYEKVEVIQTYEDFVDDAIVKDSETETGINIVHEKSIENEVPFVLDFADKGKKVVGDNTKENQVRDNVHVFVDNADKGKKFVQENIIDDEMRNDDWMDSSPSVPRFHIIFDGSKSLEDFKEKIDFLFKKL
ncbi:unnamed protein product [Lactuca virosa]|uniref:Uncharacterized protein n=1 Tax=Lactuca virosa TaxID=75947 RepID=A0AAU9MM52_9ASTR|nr:unnamed protein product [Lactuca virosa]